MNFPCFVLRAVGLPCGRQDKPGGFMAGCLPSRVGAEGHILLQVVPLSPSNTSLRAVQTADACPGGGVAPARGGGAKTGRKAPGKGTAGEPEGFGVVWSEGTWQTPPVWLWEQHGDTWGSHSSRGALEGELRRAGTDPDTFGITRTVTWSSALGQEQPV